MKKLLIAALVIALTMTMALSVSAAAGDAAQMDVYSVPVLVSCACEQFRVFSTEEAAQLPEQAQALFAEAEEALPQAVPAGMVGKDFFYVDVCEECQQTSAQFRVEIQDKLLIKQYVDGAWVTLTYTAEENGTITVEGLADGPAAFIVAEVDEEHPEVPTEPAKVSSPNAREEDLLPTVIAASCDQFTIYTTQKVQTLDEEVQKCFAQAKEALAAAVPQGMLVRYLFQVEICEVCADSTVEFQLGVYSELVIMHFDGENWVTLEYTANADGTVTVENVVDGPMAVLVK